MEKIFIKGTESALLSKVRESIRPINAILEFIDNSIDAGATEIDITYKDNKLVVKDNGKGMSKITAKKWCNEITSHISNGTNHIGIRGVGSKYALMALANLDDYSSSKVEIVTYKKNSVATHIVWVMEIDKRFEVSIYQASKKDNGTEIIINDCVSFDEKELIYTLSHHYSIISHSKKIRIKYNKKLIKFEDNCHLDLLGKNINTDGNYLLNGVAFGVRTITAINEKINDEINLKLIGITVTQNASDTCYPQSRKNCRDGGIYTLYNNRYINYGDNTIEMINKGGSDRGGRGNVRVLLLLNDENHNVFSINSDKNLGIKFLKDNTKLRSYKVVDSDFNLYDYIVDIYTKAFKIIDVETRNTHGEKSKRVEITQNIVDLTYSGKVVKKVKQDKLPITIETLDIILPNFENENPKLKEIVYMIFNSCKNAKLSDEKTIEVIKNFWKYKFNRKEVQVCQTTN